MTVKEMLYLDAKRKKYEKKSINDSKARSHDPYFMNFDPYKYLMQIAEQAEKKAERRKNYDLRNNTEI